jgi:hypothetical protein
MDLLVGHNIERGMLLTGYSIETQLPHTMGIESDPAEPKA